MNMQRSLMFYKIEMSHNAMKATKNICWAKDGWPQMDHKILFGLQGPGQSGKVS